jgi:hypothetical protein
MVTSMGYGSSGCTLNLCALSHRSAGHGLRSSFHVLLKRLENLLGRHRPGRIAGTEGVHRGEPELEGDEPDLTKDKQSACPERALPVDHPRPCGLRYWPIGSAYRGQIKFSLHDVNMVCRISFSVASDTSHPLLHQLAQRQVAPRCRNRVKTHQPQKIG